MSPSSPSRSSLASIAWPYLVVTSNMDTRNDSMPLAEGTMGRHRHVCAFFNSFDEEHRVLRSFFKDGFDKGDKAIHIVEAKNREEYLKGFVETGIDVEGVIEAGCLEV